MASMILLNESGDVTIIWSEEHEEHMKLLIEKKLKEGYSFFLVKPYIFGLVKKAVKVTSIDEITTGSKLILRDEDAIKLFEAGHIKVKKNENQKLDAERRLHGVDEILKNDTLAIKPIASG
jgi:hypothetical protein